MADAAPAGTPGTPAQTPPEAGKPAGSAVQPPAPKEGEAPVTKAELAELKNSIFAELRRALKPAEPAPAAPPAEKKTTEERLATVEAERAKDRAELAQERRDNALEKAINDLKLSSEDADFFRSFVEHKHGSQIKVEGKTVFVEAPDGPKKLGDFVTDLFKVHGKRFQPAAALPGGDGLGSSRGGSAAGGAHPFSALTYDQIMEQRTKNPDQFHEYMKGHQEEFQAKKKAR